MPYYNRFYIESESQNPPRSGGLFLNRLMRLHYKKSKRLWTVVTAYREDNVAAKVQTSIKSFILIQKLFSNSFGVNRL